MKIRKPASFKSKVIWILLILPLVYIFACWGVGLMYNRKPVFLGPYQTQMTTKIHSSLERGGEACWEVCDEECKKNEMDSKRKTKERKRGIIRDNVFEERRIIFMYPDYETLRYSKKEGQWGYGKYPQKGFAIPKDGGYYGGAGAFNPDTHDNYCSVDKKTIEKIVREGNKPEDLMKWKRYEWLRKLENSKFYWLVGNGAGSPALVGHYFIQPFKIGAPSELLNDVLGMVGCLLLLIIWLTKDLWIWFYYVYWVVAYWFGRIGFWSPNLAFKKEGWLAIFYNCFDWIPNEGRLFLMLAIIISVPVILIVSFDWIRIFPVSCRNKGRSKLSYKDFTEGKNFIRGSRLLKHSQTEKALTILAEKPDNNIQGRAGVRIWKDISLPYSHENQHILIVGSPGSGKTQITFPLVQQVIEREEKAIIWDVKGTYIQALMEQYPGVDLLAPWDKRSIQWCPGKDIINHLDCHQIASIIIPKISYESQPYFSNSARHLLEAILIQLDASGNQWGWADVWRMISQGKEELVQELQRSEEGRSAAVTIQGDSKSGQDVYSTLVSSAQSLRWLAKAWPKEGGSLRQWVSTEAGSKVLILGGIPLREDLAIATASMAIQVMINEVLSLPDNHFRRIWFFLDELATLGAMESLLKAFSLGRSKGLCIVTGIQDIGKIEHLYGVSLTKAFANTFSTAIFLRCSDAATSKWASEVMGEQEVREIQESKSSSKPGNLFGGHSTETVSHQEVAKYKSVFLPSQIANFENLSGVLRVNGWPLAFLTWPLILIHQGAKLVVDAEWVNQKTQLDDTSPDKKLPKWRLT